MPETTSLSACSHPGVFFGPGIWSNVVPRTTSNIAFFWGLICLLGGHCAAQEAAYQHPWGRFQAGSWKTVRVVTQLLDEKGNVESTTSEETKTTLTQVDDSRYTVKVEITVETDGKRYPAAPKLVTRGFYGEVNGQKALVQELGQSEVSICGRRIPSRIRRIVINGVDTKRISTVHYSSDVAPHVLRRKTTATDATAKVSSFESLVEVVAFDRLQRVLGRNMPTTAVQTVSKQANGESTVTLEYQSMTVPGGVVSHTEKTHAADGRVLRRRTLELTAYQAFTGPAPRRSRPFRARTRGRR